MTKSKKPRKRRFWLTLILVLALFPFVGVALFAIVPPTPTILMLRQVVRGEGLDYQWRGLNDISPNLVNAVIASEDARFCSHNGFDMDAIQKALDHNADGGRMRGGSTISQQTAKNVFLWPSRDWIRKGLEAGYTVLIETFWGKRRIMEVYLNVVEWAPGVYGAQAASQHWFNKNARDLTPREAARLAAILPAPRRYQAADPGPYVRRRGARVQAAMGTVRGQGLSACVLR
ncbi:monofunctional biosynthetic peptidoglycan transglycosylase [Brevundimonas nasdae]|uniref:monofunctional biosynthetic peptidoglycan transglycosylase n=1 Tax=Brevundimonas nasdae TaxID=172043 RepID=UPI0019133CAF|nr:monofunctional biosynthetic peptidoglycan transglycosylase [Brevundimonas nasdae]MBK6024777.1 monofunctional biosynthetic peptidoglycan transglycosylase [Brevundimonas nasdae]MDQ0451259.1 monofunctional biosynthetic peptidoglycan transglycosylase [Brevundimonas nasdae]